jgi:hypothetical protein
MNGIFLKNISTACGTVFSARIDETRCVHPEEFLPDCPAQPQNPILSREFCREECLTCDDGEPPAGVPPVTAPPVLPPNPPVTPPPGDCVNCCPCPCMPCLWLPCQPCQTNCACNHRNGNREQNHNRNPNNNQNWQTLPQWFNGEESKEVVVASVDE